MGVNTKNNGDDVELNRWPLFSYFFFGLKRDTFFFVFPPPPPPPFLLLLTAHFLPFSSIYLLTLTCVYSYFGFGPSMNLGIWYIYLFHALPLFDHVSSSKFSPSYPSLTLHIFFTCFATILTPIHLPFLLHLIIHHFHCLLSTVYCLLSQSPCITPLTRTLN